MARKRALLALTCGEPAGVAAEITAQAWLALRSQTDFQFVLIGDCEQLQKRASSSGFDVPFAPVSSASDVAGVFSDGVPVLHRPLVCDSVAGQLDGRNAKPVIAAIDEAVTLCLSRDVDAMVTNPIQKETLYGAGFSFQGHTDYLAQLTRDKGYAAHDVMMLVAGDLRAVPITVHIPLVEIVKHLSAEMIVTQGLVVRDALIKYFGVAAPRIAVTGLNPHAGENGAMGTEEKTLITPAIRELQSRGVTAFGPLPADTAFHAEARASYDAILCMYHDQALIPAKTLDFHGGVNVTLGLPFIRTSPDHGTALGIAGQGVANPTSLIAALNLAHRMAAHQT